MLRSKLKNWPIFNMLEPEFIPEISMVVVHGSSGYKALIVTKEQMVYGVGTNKNGCLGTGDTCDTFEPIRVGELCGKNIKTFAFGKDHVLALTKEGMVYSWGHNQYGQLGNKCYEPCLVPTLIKVDVSDVPVTNIACGASHCLALTGKGEVYSWGGIAKRVNIPTAVTNGLSNLYVTSVTCGEEFNMIITDKGKVYSWGENNVGQLGIGSRSVTEVPCRVSTLDGVVIKKVVCGSAHTLALSTVGALYVWGRNNFGQLGLTNVGGVSTPTKLETKMLKRVVDIAASYCNDISVAMGEENTVLVWGKCLGQSVKLPTFSPLTCLHDAFAFYSSRCITHEPLIFDGEEMGLSLTDCLSKTFNDPTTSDLIIEVRGEPIHVHKAILKIRCRHLRTRFEECWDKNNQSVIEIEEFSYIIYRAFLQYLYTGDINLPVRDVIELCSLANTYSEDGLKDLCMYKLKMGITIENVVSLYNDSVRYETKEIKEYCFNFALTHIAILLRIPAFQELDARTLKSFVLAAVEEDIF